MRLTIIGASGHGKAVADNAHPNGYGDIQFFDGNPLVTSRWAYPVVGTKYDAVAIDDGVWIGTSAIIINNLKICLGVIIGADAVLVKALRLLVPTWVPLLKSSGIGRRKPQCEY